jgi:DNA-binding response OmpR family regulator
MTGTTRSRTGRVRVLIVDDEPALTPKELDLLGPLMEHPRQVPGEARSLDKTDRGRVPVIHTVRGPGSAIRPVEEGR